MNILRKRKNRKDIISSERLLLQVDARFVYKNIITPTSLCLFLVFCQLQSVENRFGTGFEAAFYAGEKEEVLKQLAAE